MIVAAKQQSVIEQLKPTRNLKIMDLVADAGVDVSGWAVTADGQAVRNPRANPNYCYEWAFGGRGLPIALCVWHDALEMRERRIVFKANLRSQALRLEEITFDRRAPRDVRSRAKEQAARSRRFDELVQEAYRSSLPIRLIIVDGERAADRELGLDSSKVKSRKLDDLDWYVQHYGDETGDLLLVRGVATSTPNLHAEPSSESTRFVDQFSIEDPQKRKAPSSSYVRSAEVRRKVLQRAAGICECCGAQGFVTSSGEIFLETHHVLSLSEGGPDHACNVVAICPNDHRRAHYGIDRLDLRRQLINHLGALYPAEIARLRQSIAVEEG